MIREEENQSQKEEKVVDIFQVQPQVQQIITEDQIMQLKPIPRKPHKPEDQVGVDGTNPSSTIDSFMHHLSQITAGEGDSRHLSNTANSGKMADLIRRFESLMPPYLEGLRFIIVKVLIKTMNEVILRKFIENNGLEILNKWLGSILIDV